MKFRTLPILASSCFLAFTANAQEAPKPPAAEAPQLDRMPGVTLDMIRAGLERRFDRMDANGDGFITKDEAVNLQPQARNDRARGDGRPRGERRGPEGQRSDRLGRGFPTPTQNLPDADTDQDGQVSRAEWAAQFDELAAHDVNGDGRLDMKELSAYRGRGQSVKQKSKPQE